MMGRVRFGPCWKKGRCSPRCVYVLFPTNKVVGHRGFQVLEAMTGKGEYDMKRDNHE